MARLTTTSVRGSGYRSKITDAEGVTTSLYSDGRAEARKTSIDGALAANPGLDGLEEGSAHKANLQDGPETPGSTD